MSLLDEPPAEVTVDEALVRDLLADQAPHLASGPVTIIGNGWDNVVARIGAHHVARLPRRQVAVPLIEHEQRWLPVLASRLPVLIPAPVVAGVASDRFPWPWTVTRWFPGRTAAQAPPADLDRLAETLAAFLSALHVDAPDDAPSNPVRGIHLAGRRELTAGWLGRLGASVPADLGAVWEQLCELPAWPGPPQWLHGDLHPDNLVVDDDGLVAVIDWGDLTAGDPATDLAIAWLLLPPGPRARLRAELAYDDQTWLRGMGWALSLGAALAAHSAQNPTYEALGRATLGGILDDLRTR